MQVKVFAEVLPQTLGYAFRRINAALRKAAPPEVTFVTSPGAADLQILDVVDLGSLTHLRAPRYVLWQHAFRSTERPDPSVWAPWFRRAQMVVSFLDLYTLTGCDDFNFYRTPHGVDGSVFYDRQLPRVASILTTGSDPHGEAIEECHAAAAAARPGERPAAIHVGRAQVPTNAVRRYSHLRDVQLAELYSRTRYVSALRRIEGFELPALEGLACGARPICFDIPDYREWFDRHAVFVPEVPSPDLVEVLVEVLRDDPKPVTDEERDQILRRFDWTAIYTEFWARLCGRGRTA